MEQVRLIKVIYAQPLTLSTLTTEEIIIFEQE